MPQTALEETETNETVIDAPQQEAPAKQEENSEFEIEIVDDVPEEDKGRESMPEEIVENLEKDELDEYTKEKGKQLKKVWNDERRAKEAAIKERDHAAKLAKQAIEENKLLRQHLTQGEKVLMDNSKSSAEHELALAKKTFKEAYDAGDADLVAEASEKLATAKLNMAKAEEYVPKYSEEALQTQKDSVNKESEPSVNYQQAPQADAKALAWQERNKSWWGIDRAMTSLAFGTHETLVNQGVDPTSDEYYAAIDKEMRQRFPEKFEQEAEETPSTNGSGEQAQKTVVSPAKRSTSSKRVVLTNSEVRLAKRLGLSPEQYVREKLKLEV
tara:strand:+ start:545 stop:1528 length:984 start_codon:yes stop_codon:yes gene_type:complete